MPARPLDHVGADEITRREVAVVRQIRRILHQVVRARIDRLAGVWREAVSCSRLVQTRFATGRGRTAPFLARVLAVLSAGWRGIKLCRNPRCFAPTARPSRRRPPSPCASSASSRRYAELRIGATMRSSELCGVGSAARVDSGDLPGAVLRIVRGLPEVEEPVGGGEPECLRCGIVDAPVDPRLRWVRLFFVGGPEGSRAFCKRHGKSYLTRRRRGEEGGGGGSVTGGAFPPA